MNTQTLLNKRPQILQSTLKLTSLIVKTNREELTQKTLLFRKREKVSKQRTKAFSALNQTAKESDGGLTTGGLLAGGVLSRIGRGRAVNNIRPFRQPVKPGSLSGIRRIGGRISRGNVIANTLFAGLDFANRKSIGQTNLQAGLGSGGGAVGGIAGAAIGQTLIPIPVLGALIGGFVGSNIGSNLADRASGVTGSDFRRLQLERESIRESGRTEFTGGLDRFESALNKLRKYDEDNKESILGATGNDPRNRFRFLPRILVGGGATQEDIDTAYGKGVGVGVGGLATAVIGTVVTIKAGSFLLSGAALAKLRSLLGLVVKSKGKPIDVKILGEGSVKKVIKKIQPIKKQPIKKIKPKVTRSKTKPFEERKILKGQDKVTSSDKVQIYQKYDINKRKRFQRIINKSTNEDVNAIIREGKKLGIDKQISPSAEIKESKKILNDFLKNNPEAGSLQKNLFRKNKNFDIKNPQDISMNTSDNIIFKEGDNYFVNNSKSGGMAGGRSESADPYLASLNTLKAYSYLTA